MLSCEGCRGIYHCMAGDKGKVGRRSWRLLARFLVLHHGGSESCSSAGLQPPVGKIGEISIYQSLEMRGIKESDLGHATWWNASLCHSMGSSYTVLCPSNETNPVHGLTDTKFIPCTKCDCEFTRTKPSKPALRGQGLGKAGWRDVRRGKHIARGCLPALQNNPSLRHVLGHHGGVFLHGVGWWQRG